MRFPKKLFLSAGMLYGAVCSTGAFTVIDDFETERNYTAQDGMTVSRSSFCAADGGQSLLLTAPRWGENPNEWPAMYLEEFTPKDWSEFEVFSLDAFNPLGVPQKVIVDIMSGTSSAKESFVIPPFSYYRFEFPFSKFPEGFDKADVRKLTLFTECPMVPYRVYLDRIALGKEGEAVPEAKSFQEQVIAIAESRLDALRKKLHSIAGLEVKFAENQAVKSFLNKELNAINAEIDAISRTLANQELSLVERSQCTEGVGRFVQRAERLEKLLKQLPPDTPPVVVKTASAMDRIYPADIPLALSDSNNISLQLAGNDKGGVQVVVLPLENICSQVEVSIGNLQDRNGNILPAESFQISPVGFVNVEEYSRHKFGYLGWTPDPIMNFLSAVDVEVGAAQPFYISYRSAKDQAPGIYQGTVSVKSGEQLIRQLPMTVRIYDFNLPDRSLLPQTITTTYPQPKQQTKELNAAETMEAKRAVAFFLADYMISFDHFYNERPADLELLKELSAKNILGGINMRYIQASPEDAEAKALELIKSIRPSYDILKEAGLLEHCYLYGFDELPESYFEAFEYVAKALHKEFPELKIMTTAYDYSMGTESMLQSVDWWCPLIPKYKPEIVEKARANGDQVWWYTSCDPSHPYVGIQLEDQPLEARILMGAMTAKYRPDGYLFYETTYWRDNKPITQGPYTNWNAHSYSTYNADGAWFYPGPDGTFLPSLRLENFRDGADDYAFFVILSAMADQVEKEEQLRIRHYDWLSQARAALEVPSTLVESFFQFNRDPEALEAWSNRMAELIEEAPLNISDIDDGRLNVWGKSVYSGDKQ